MTAGLVLLHQLNHDIESTGDTGLIGLRDELAAYPRPPPVARLDTRAILVPLRVGTRGTVLSLFSTTTVFGRPRDVTLAGLAIESFYPADSPTAAFLSGALHSRDDP